jgi:hypothetical protein
MQLQQQQHKVATIHVIVEDVVIYTVKRACGMSLTEALVGGALQVSTYGKKPTTRCICTSRLASKDKLFTTLNQTSSTVQCDLW